MNSLELAKQIRIVADVQKPKYLQLADAVVSEIRKNRIKIGDALPSINNLSAQIQISRDTVEKAYKHLRKTDVAMSVSGKGYFVTNQNLGRIRIALFLNKLSTHKKTFYDAFTAALGDTAELDFFIYNSDVVKLHHMLLSAQRDYDYYVVFPHFKQDRERATEVLSLVPPEKLLLLGARVDGIKGNYANIYEDHEKDILSALVQLRPQLAKYHTIKLLFPDDSDYPVGIVKGFRHFCKAYHFKQALVGSLAHETINKGVCYISLIDNDLSVLLDKIMDHDFSLGRDVGVISYNETALKRYLMNGITTISTDLRLMGAHAAQSILEPAMRQIRLPFRVTERKSV